MTDVLLIAPPWSSVYGKLDVKKLGWGMPPLGLAYITAFLERENVDVKLVDMTFQTEGWKDLENMIEKENPYGFIENRY